MIKPRHPLFSPASIILTVVFLAGLAVMIVLNGNLVFSPGQLSAKAAPELNSGGVPSHAAFEKECRRCHAPLAGDPQALCLECHVTIAQEIEGQIGLHSKIEQKSHCADCHPEHRGSAFDPGLAALEHFDHSWTSFSLAKHLVDYEVSLMDCTACHSPDQDYLYQTEGCTDCHSNHDAAFLSQHIQDYGQDCLVCHDGTDRAAAFDHAGSEFPLSGQHASASCAACHGSASPAGKAALKDGQLTMASFENTAQACAACHAQPPSHQGALSAECQECHTPESWEVVEWEGRPFSHADAGFSLVHHGQDYAGQPISCLGCHTRAFQGAGMEACIACHSEASGPQGIERAEFMQAHIEQFGQDCLACHNGADRLSEFDHQAVFPLEGRHAALECQACHADKIFQGTPTDCSGCHAEPEIHAGEFGLNCADCHTAAAWSPAALRSHSFPLDHGEGGLVSCETCHTETYIQYTCFGCHEHPLAEMVEKHAEEKISFEELQACVKCHPSGEEDE